MQARRVHGFSLPPGGFPTVRFLSDARAVSLAGNHTLIIARKVGRRGSSLISPAIFCKDGSGVQYVEEGQRSLAADGLSGTWWTS